MASLTWLGHASFRLDTADGKRIYVDPFLSGPTFPESEKEIDRADVIAITHGHGDHASDAVELQQEDGRDRARDGRADRLVRQAGSARATRASASTRAARSRPAASSFTMTNAFHSSSAPDGSYAGEPAGFVVGVDGQRIYFAGDTSSSATCS